MIKGGTDPGSGESDQHLKLHDPSDLSVGDLCQAMFIEGARGLGYTREAQLSQLRFRNMVFGRPPDRQEAGGHNSNCTNLDRIFGLRLRRIRSESTCLVPTCFDCATLSLPLAQ